MRQPDYYYMTNSKLHLNSQICQRKFLPWISTCALYFYFIFIQGLKTHAPMQTSVASWATARDHVPCPIPHTLLMHLILKLHSCFSIKLDFHLVQWHGLDCLSLWLPTQIISLITCRSRCLCFKKWATFLKWALNTSGSDKRFSHELWGACVDCLCHFHFVGNIRPRKS